MSAVERTFLAVRAFAALIACLLLDLCWGIHVDWLENASSAILEDSDTSPHFLPQYMDDMRVLSETGRLTVGVINVFLVMTAARDIYRVIKRRRRVSERN